MGTPESRADAIPTTATWLGRAGLLPFIAAPLAMYLLPEQADLAGHALSVYALVIICFLVGVWWGLAIGLAMAAITLGWRMLVMMRSLGRDLSPRGPAS